MTMDREDAKALMMFATIVVAALSVGAFSVHACGTLGGQVGSVAKDR